MNLMKIRMHILMKIKGKMGVPGLTTFIDKNNHILQDFKLCNIKIIIDGNNLLHHIYYRYNVGVRHGGEYLTFSECCEHYFEPFFQCSVNCYIVFDGSYDKDGRKFKTVLKRDKNKILEYNKIAEGLQTKSQVLPLLATNVFNNVLNDLRIPKITCLTEADQCIASLAKEWNCPVLTNDSDFFIYELPAGLILIDYLDQNVVKEFNYCYMNVPIYYCVVFKQWAKIKDDNLALFATLLGNDLIDAKQFDQFFARKTIMFAKREDKIKGLLGWLSSKASTQSALSEILNCINFQNQEKVKSVMLTSIKEYNQPTKSYASLHFQNSHTIDTCDCLTSFREIVPYITPPLAYLFISHNIPIRLLELLSNYRLTAMCQIERLGDISTQECSLKLRRMLYGSIANSIDNHNILIQEYKRVKAQIIKEIVRPLFENTAGTKTFSFVEIVGLSLMERQKYVVECLVGQLQCQIEHYDNNLFYICVLCYWFEATKPSKLLLQAILLVMFTQPSIKNTKALYDSRNNTESFDKVVKSNSPNNACPNNNNSHQLKWNKFSKENLPPVDYSKNFTYRFCQFQSCLQAAIYINSIFLMPFSPIICINSSFLQSIYNYLELNGEMGLKKILALFSDIEDDILESLCFIKKHTQEWEFKQTNIIKVKSKKGCTSVKLPLPQLDGIIELSNKFSLINE